MYVTFEIAISSKMPSSQIPVSLEPSISKLVALALSVSSI